MASPPATPDSFSLYPKSKSLFAESPLLSLRPTGPGGDDLSLSELSMTDTPVKAGPSSTGHREPARFSLFGATDSPEKPREEEEERVETEQHQEDSQERVDESAITEDAPHLNGKGEETVDQIEDSILATPKRPTTPQHARSRDDTLRATLYQMRKINGVLQEYLEALHATEESNRVLAQQVDNSNRLLNKYTALLGQTEHTARLLLDPQWQGAEADEIRAAELMEHERLEKERLEREEQERLERLEQERIEKLEREEREREARQKAVTAALRGKPGAPRARGRGVTRGAVPTTSASTTRGRGTPPTGLRRPTVIRSGGTRGRGRAT